MEDDFDFEDIVLEEGMDEPDINSYLRQYFQRDLPYHVKYNLATILHNIEGSIGGLSEDSPLNHSWRGVEGRLQMKMELDSGESMDMVSGVH